MLSTTTVSAEPHAIDIKEQACTSDTWTLKPITKNDRQGGGGYVDFNELPPVRGLNKAAPPQLESQVVIVQADDLAVSHKLIPNFETWSQCFSIYAAVRIANDPSKAGDLMAYTHSIASMAKRYPWPSWIMYDESSREEALVCQPGCGEKRTPAYTLNASIKVQPRHPIGAVTASRLSTRLIGAPTNLPQ